MTAQTAAPIWMTVAEAADYLRVSKPFLNKARCYGGGPRFSKLGSKRILYNRADLDTWVLQWARTSTSDEGRQARQPAG